MKARVAGGREALRMTGTFDDNDSLSRYAEESG